MSTIEHGVIKAQTTQGNDTMANMTTPEMGNMTTQETTVSMML